MIDIQSSPLILYFIAVLLASSPVAFVLERLSRRAPALFSGAFLIASGSALALSGTLDGTFFVLADLPFLGRIALFADGLSSLMLIALLAIAGLVSISGTWSGGEKPEAQRGFQALFLLYVAGVAGLFLSANLVLLFAFLELTLIASWLVLGWWGGQGRGRTSIKYFLYTELGALIFLAGVLMLWGSIGTLDALSAPSGTPISPGSMLAVAFIIAGVFVKSAVFPTHGWLPDAYSESPPKLAAALSFSTVAIGAYLLLRVFGSFVPGALSDPRVSGTLAAFGLFNIIYGGLAAIRQKDLRRVLSYSSISQAGYVLIGVASATQIGFLGVLIWAVAHGFGKSALFLISGEYRRLIGTDSLDGLGGLAGKMPVTSSSLLLSFLSLAGIPPTLGFWGEFFILFGFASSLLSAGIDPLRMGVLVVTAAFTVVSAAYGLWTARRILYGESAPGSQGARDRPSFALPLFSMVLVLVALGIMPFLLTGAFWIYHG
ncbi:MAG: complex I subunit 4 family protein [Candidatus Methanosuratincola sp.]|nr:proton-conducting transporter membrane subunit [Candidatus Methanosuratincola sp.]